MENYAIKSRGKLFNCSKEFIKFSTRVIRSPEYVTKCSAVQWSQKQRTSRNTCAHKILHISLLSCFYRRLFSRKANKIISQIAQSIIVQYQTCRAYEQLGFISLLQRRGLKWFWVVGLVWMFWFSWIEKKTNYGVSSYWQFGVNDRKLLFSSSLILKINTNKFSIPKLTCESPKNRNERNLLRPKCLSF